MTTPDDPCTLGNLEFVYEHDQPLLGILDGHGVQIEGRIVGVLNRDSDTLLDRPDGTGVSVGDTIRHSAEFCAEGRRQGAM